MECVLKTDFDCNLYMLRKLGMILQGLQRCLERQFDCKFTEVAQVLNDAGRVAVVFREVF